MNKEDLVYLRQNLVLEPLVDCWYAWTHLVSPATAALNIKERHLRIMNSYIQNPQLHAEAVKNPKMLGGPFIDYNGQRVDEITKLRDQTQERCGELLKLCDAINRLNELLAREASGYSLASLYPKVPAELRGYVELFYDLNNNASYRFFEPLLYNSIYYNEQLQSCNLFLINDDDSRSFVLSTPRLPDSKTLRLNLLFKDSRINDFFALLSKPDRWENIIKLLDIQPGQEALFSTFFTEKVPPVYNKYKGNGVLTRYFGHACILVETKNTAVLVDPVISYGYESDISRYTFEDLPETIDFVLFTHNHQDHILFETLLRIRRKIRHLVVPKSSGGSLQDPDLKLMFRMIGFESVIELGEFEILDHSDCSITGIPFLGEHADIDIRSKICHLVRFKNNGYKVLFAADSCNVEPTVYERIQPMVGVIDILFLGMECDGAPLSWLYGPLMPKTLEREKDQSRRLAGCNFDQSRALINVFHPRHVFVYAMGMEPWLKFISSIKYTDQSRPIIESDKTLEYCFSGDIQAERLFGERIIEY
ncbi:MAG: MBL fold metallo-hydrolase [Bacteroidetes bacterium]|nr:MBL fold metallo-hydrolase [Bacteroidota bacterium]